MILMGTGLTATSILTEKRIGDLERNQVVGVKISEIVAAYIVTESVLLNITIITIMMTLFWLFGVTLKGSIGTVYCLFLNCGLCGMSYGIVIAAVCEKEFTALFFCAGSLMPLVILSGIIWPLQGMHVVLQWIAHIFPVYIASEAFRNITQKGWGWEKAGVYKGFLTMSIWTLTFLLISFIYIKFFRNR
ncbi:hypothetical protein FQR65_LT06158 [Abscondita terminalis]|nr:hypothetical protein FQR65_LT06158 [Abscondita terminalis]